MIFGMWLGYGGRLLIFGKSGSKVKVKYPQKNCLFGPILGTVVRYGSDQDQAGSGGVPLATCQKLENDGGSPLDGFSSIGNLPV